MKKIVSILLVGLLGFLGCSGSDDDTNTIGEAIPVAPFGIIETPTPTYEWTPVPWATKYRLLVQDTNQVATIQDSNETSIIDEWYTAEEAGCAAEDELCAVTPDMEVSEENTWTVLACANQECGVWSEPLQFDFTAINGPRFTDNGDGTVIDNYTLTWWTKSAGDPPPGGPWDFIRTLCDDFRIAQYSDWFLPRVWRLQSLIDKRQKNPSLPAGHPFTDVYIGPYWTANSRLYSPDLRLGVYVTLVDGNTGFQKLDGYGHRIPGRAGIWCARCDRDEMGDCLSPSSAR